MIADQLRGHIDATSYGLHLPHPGGSPSPNRELQRLIETATPAQRTAIARELIRWCRAPGRAGVLGVSHLLQSTPRSVLPDMIRAVWKVRPHRSAWACGMYLSWLGTSPAVLHAAGGLPALGAWFDYANLLDPPPFMRFAFYTREELAPVTKLYRGASSRRSFADTGLSWSPFRDTAASYALLRTSQYGGSPVIYEAEIEVAALSFATRTAEAEYVTLTSPTGRVNTDDAGQIRELAHRCAFRSAGTKLPTHFNLRFDSDDGWCGWTGDA